MIVVDASVLVNALTDDGPLGEAGRTELSRDPHWAAPHHIVVETFSALRGRDSRRLLTEDRCARVLEALDDLSIEYLDTIPLLGRMWQLRATVSAYDAAYLAAAEQFGCQLVTADARLARASGIRCVVRLAVPER